MKILRSAALVLAVVAIALQIPLEADTRPELPPTPASVAPFLTAARLDAIGGPKLPRHTYRLRADGALMQSTTWDVCASGCDYTNTKAQLQLAFDTAAAGDTILLQQGITYTGAFKMRRHGGGSMITVRTGVTSNGSAVPLSTFPAANVRMTPALAAAANLAKLRTDANNEPAITTADPSGNTAPEYWTLKWLEVVPWGTSGFYGGGPLVQCGSDSNTTQPTYSVVPNQFTFEQLYLHGDPVRGQFRGISIHCNNVTVKDSWISDIKSRSEGQGIFINSSNGPHTITNNYIEANAEDVLAGGSGGAMRPDVTVAAAPTSATQFSITIATANSPIGELHVGQQLTVDYAGVEYAATVVSCGTSVQWASCTNTALTVSSGLPSTPTAGADVDYGPVPGLGTAGLSFTYNHVTKNPDWRNNILGTPQGVQAVCLTTGGTLTGGTAGATYYYRVVARMTVANGSTANSAPSAEVNCPMPAGTTTGSVVLTWNATANADTYRAYGRSSGGQNVYFTATAPTVTLTDTGGAGTTEAVPTSGSKWYVKNIFELKNYLNATIEHNVFEYVWSAQQTGYAILFTPSNTGNSNDSTCVGNVTFRYNVIRHAAGVFQITGRDASGGDPVCRTNGITIAHNYAEDIGTEWGSSNRTFLFTTTVGTAYASGTHEHGPINVTVDHNTFRHTSGNAAIYLDQYKASAERAVENFAVTNNIFYKLGFGLTGNNSCGQGDYTSGATIGCWTQHTKGTSSILKNVWADIDPTIYPGGAAQNFGPTSAELGGMFAADGSLVASSPYNNAGSDGTDIGANMALVTPGINIALTGDNTGGPAPVAPPAITTATIHAGKAGDAYSVTFEGTCSAAPCTWSLTGTRPAGINPIVAATGVLAGTPLIGDTQVLTILYTDANGQVASRQFTLVIEDLVDPGSTPGTVTRPPVFDFQACASLKSDTEPTEVATGQPLGVCDRWFNPLTGAWKTVTATSPAVTWSAMIAGAPAVQTIVWATSITNSNVAAGGEEFLGNSGRGWLRLDAENSTQILVTGFQNSACAGTDLTFKVQYSTDGSAFTDLTSWDCSAGVPVLKGGSTYLTLPEAARIQGLILRGRYMDGNGTNDPTIHMLTVRLR